MRVVDDNRSSRFGDGFQNYFTKSEREVALILLDLCYPVDFETPIFSLKWGVRKLRSSVFRDQPLKTPPTFPAIKYLPPSPDSEMRSSMSSCLSDDMENTPPKNKNEFSSKCERLKRNSSTQQNIFLVLDKILSEREGFPIPVMEQAVLERQRVFREQRQRRIAIRRSKNKLRKI